MAKQKGYLELIGADKPYTPQKLKDDQQAAANPKKSDALKNQILKGEKKNG